MFIFCWFCVYLTPTIPTRTTWRSEERRVEGIVGVRYSQNQQKRTYNVFIFCSMLFYQIILGGISWHMKPMSVILLLSASRESLSQTWNYYWNPCLVRKWANVVKAYILSTPPPFIYRIWWYIDTVKVVEK